MVKLETCVTGASALADFVTCAISSIAIISTDGRVETFIISTDGRVEAFIINTDGRVKAFSVSDSPLPLGVAGVRVDLEAWAVVQRKTSESEIKINV